MASVNKVILVGHLGKDPEVKTFNSGDKVCNFSLATSESWKDRNTGERRQKSEWHNVAITNQGLVTVAERYLKKGSKVYIEGQLQTRSWESDSGKKYITEIVLRPLNGELVMLDGKDKSSDTTRQDHQAPIGGGEFDDSIPFMRHQDGLCF